MDQTPQNTYMWDRVESHPHENNHRMDYCEGCAMKTLNPRPHWDGSDKWGERGLQIQHFHQRDTQRHLPVLRQSTLLSCDYCVIWPMGFLSANYALMYVHTHTPSVLTYVVLAWLFRTSYPLPQISNHSSNFLLERAQRKKCLFLEREKAPKVTTKDGLVKKQQKMFYRFRNGSTALEEAWVTVLSYKKNWYC